MFKIHFNVFLYISLIILGIFQTLIISFDTPLAIADATPTSEASLFSLGVVTQKDTPIIKIKLMIPDGLSEVTPNVKLGWKVEVVKDQDKAREIVWSNGVLPADQRDEFVFSAKTSSKEGDLKWKGSQTYQDGSEVFWGENKDKENTIVTKIADKNHSESEKNPTNVLIGVVSVVGLILSIIAVSISLKNQK